MTDIGQPQREIEVIPLPKPEESPIKEPSPSPVAPDKEPVPA